MSFLVFFCSSRRRHTRSTRDWSSDVCSSDLAFAIVDRPLCAPGGQPGAQRGRSTMAKAEEIKQAFDEVISRSEERRVGKAGGWRGASEGQTAQGTAYGLSGRQGRARPSARTV